MQKGEIPSVAADAVKNSCECAAGERSTEKGAGPVFVPDVLADVESALAAPVQEGEGGTGPVSQKTVFVVEHRQHLSALPGSSSLFSYRAELVYIASTIEKAVEWCRRNVEYAPHSLDRPWDFAVRKRELDGDLVGGGLVMVLDWDGEVTGWTV